MYIRFETSARDTDARCNSGMFCAAFDIWYDQINLRALWQVQEMRRLLTWFNHHLSAPEKMHYRPNRKGEISGVCWFRATSGVFVSQGRYLAWLLEDIGCPIDERRSQNPGRVLWQDAHQIVATRYL